MVTLTWFPVRTQHASNRHHRAARMFWHDWEKLWESTQTVRGIRDLFVERESTY